MKINRKFASLYMAGLAPVISVYRVNQLGRKNL